MPLHYLGAGLGADKETHKDQLKRVCLVLVGAIAKPLTYSRLGGEEISIAPNSVGAVSNRTGPRPYGNERHESSSVAAPSMNW